MLGLGAVTLGAVGVVVPGLPSTVFFLFAAAAFARSSPRLEAWLLGLPGVGTVVADHRAGLGMPRRAKVVAIGCIVVFCGVAVWRLGTGPVGLGIAVLGAVGVAWITWRVPTKEAVLARGARGSRETPGSRADGGGHG